MHGYLTRTPAAAPPRRAPRQKRQRNACCIIHIVYLLTVPTRSANKRVKQMPPRHFNISLNGQNSCLCQNLERRAADNAESTRKNKDERVQHKPDDIVAAERTLVYRANPRGPLRHMQRIAQCNAHYAICYRRDRRPPVAAPRHYNLCYVNLNYRRPLESAAGAPARDRAAAPGSRGGAPARPSRGPRSPGRSFEPLGARPARAGRRARGRGRRARHALINYRHPPRIALAAALLYRLSFLGCPSRCANLCTLCTRSITRIAINLFYVRFVGLVPESLKLVNSREFSNERTARESGDDRFLTRS
ncbi:hypothetical protein EVAR_66901_1 [Eumeta japonica]|uniref:Uncharacterized protein n=1 Tax=Eumeta variegata TaxID=151549 RepID=A0A4C2ADK5_EUMVA|nr:hypothetical protein EVAR_66901_1 [Eumeta japonica]